MAQHAIKRTASERRRSIGAVTAIALAIFALVAMSPMASPSYTLAAANAAAPLQSADNTPADTAMTSDQVVKAIALAKTEVVKLSLTWEREVILRDTTGKISRKQQLVQASCSGSFVGQEKGQNNGTILTAGHCRPDEEVVASFDAEIERLINPGSNSMDPSGPIVIGPPKGTQPAAAQLTILQTGKLDKRIQVTQEKGLEGAVVTTAIDARPLPGVIPFEDGDEALVKIDGLPFTPAAKLASRAPIDGEDVWSLGYAGNLDDETLSPDVPRPSSGVIFDPNNPGPDCQEQGPYDNNPGQLAKDVSNSRISVAALKGAFGGKHFVKGTEFYLSSVPLSPGMSGGLSGIMEGGELKLVGLNSYSLDIQQLNLVTSLSTTTGFLKSSGITSVATSTDVVPNQASTKTSDSLTKAVESAHQDNLRLLDSNQQLMDSVGTSNIILGLLIVMIVAVIIAALIYRRRRSSDSRLDEDTDVSITGPRQD